MRSQLVGSQQKELDSCILFIQEASSQLRACFCQQFIHRMMSLETGSTHTPETCIDGQYDLMPSVVFQELFLELRKLEKLVEDGVFEVDWLMELLRELIEAINVWISNNKAIWAISKENFTVQHSDNFKKFILDMHFLVEISKRGGYFSNNTLVLVNSMRSAFVSDGPDPDRDAVDDGWAINAANKAITKLLKIEKRNMPPNNNSVGIHEEELHEKQSDYVSDSLQDDAMSYSKNFMRSGDDEGNASEADAKAETMILNTEFSPLGWFLDLLEKDDGSVYGSAINSTESSVEIEDIVSRKMANAVNEGLQIIEKTDLLATLSVDIDGKYSEAWDFIEEVTSHQVNVAESVSNKLEDGGNLGVSGTVVTPAEDSVELRGGHEKEGLNLAASILMNDCNNIHIAAVNTLYKHEDIDVKEIECIKGFNNTESGGEN